MSEIVPLAAEPIPAFTGQVPGDLCQAIGRALAAGLLRGRIGVRSEWHSAPP